MGTIEYYAEQMDNSNKLISEAIEAYQKVIPYACHCGKCDNGTITTFDPFDPIENYNHTWKFVKLLENFGYTGYDYDTVFYTFYLECPECDDHEKLIYEGDGLNFGQAVCNTLIKFANDYKFTP
jgi:hypothetical protein